MKIAKSFVKVLRSGYATAKKVDPKNGSRLRIFLDIIYCRLRFRTTFEEYLEYNFYNFKDSYRKKFLLLYHKRNKFKIISDGKTTYSKQRFFKSIPDCFFHEIILAPSCGEEAFVEFAKRHGRIVTKPDRGSCGQGIEFFTHTDDEKTRKFFRSLPDNTICEEFICQHEKMNAINPYSVNTIRIVSLIYHDDIEIISATLRTGSQADVSVDNLKKDGIGAQIDVSTGIITTMGFDYNGGRFITHPVTEVQFLGYNIPNWDEAIALVKKAHKKLPQCKILGWDIAITPKGADIIEANSRPGTPIMQMVDLIPKGEKVFEVIKEEKKKKKH